MQDTATFLGAIYAFVDDYLHRPAPMGAAHLLAAVDPPHRPGPAPTLSVSQTLTLCLLSQWRRFSSERDFYRYVCTHWSGFFPHLPDRSQYLRQCQRLYPLLVACQRELARCAGAARSPYQALDLTAVPVRAAKRRGSSWLAGQACIGHSNRLGWFYGFQLLVCVTADGLITGWALGEGSARDQRLAEDFLLARHAQTPGAEQVGAPVPGGYYVADTGFEGARFRWPALAQLTNQHVIAPPKRSFSATWPAPWRYWLASHRQIVETVIDKLHHSFQLSQARARCHTLAGQMRRIAAKCTLHNLLAYFNCRLQRPLLEFDPTVPI